MKISEDTKNVLNALDYISGNKLRKRNDLAVLTELCVSHETPKALDNMIFTGAALWNLHSSMKKDQMPEDSEQLILKELTGHLHKLREQLLEIMKNNKDNEIGKRFEDVYFQQSQGALKNLIDLSFDLKMFKELQNQSKRL